MVHNELVNQASIEIVFSSSRIELPLPPLEVQREIVAEIEGYQKVIDGARVVVENYRPHIVIDLIGRWWSWGRSFEISRGTDTLANLLLPN